MEIVYLAENVHEMSNLFFWRKIRKQFQNIVCSRDKNNMKKKILKTSFLVNINHFLRKSY